MIDNLNGAITANEARLISYVKTEDISCVLDVYNIFVMCGNVSGNVDQKKAKNYFSSIACTFFPFLFCYMNITKLSCIFVSRHNFF